MTDETAEPTPLDRLLERFVGNFHTPAYRAAGVKPTHLDLALTPGDLRAMGAKLLAEYDAMRGVAAAEASDETETLRQQLAEALEQVDARQKKIGELVAENRALREAATSTAPPAALAAPATSTNAPPPEAP
jgi:hypothetical protein